jgi:hypothetical protein
MQRQAYAPEPGYMFQIFTRNPQYGRAWEHCDYAKDRAEKKYLIENYRLAYGPSWEFSSIVLPYKFWSKKEAQQCTQ